MTALVYGEKDVDGKVWIKLVILPSSIRCMYQTWPGNGSLKMITSVLYQYKLCSYELFGHMYYVLIKSSKKFSHLNIGGRNVR